MRKMGLPLPPERVLLPLLNGTPPPETARKGLPCARGSSCLNVTDFGRQPRPPFGSETFGSDAAKRLPSQRNSTQ